MSEKDETSEGVEVVITTMEAYEGPPGLVKAERPRAAAPYVGRLNQILVGLDLPPSLWIEVLSGLLLELGRYARPGTEELPPRIIQAVNDMALTWEKTLEKHELLTGDTLMALSFLAHRVAACAALSESRIVERWTKEDGETKS